MALAFLPVPAIIAETPVEAKPKRPVFKKRWWYRKDRLDARPVIWSFYNHPEEWESADGRPYYFFRHMPSGHLFKLRGGGAAQLCDTRCSCQQATRGRFQRFQSRALSDAARWWEYEYKHPTPVHDPMQFAGHFVHE